MNGKYATISTVNRSLMKLKCCKKVNYASFFVLMVRWRLENRVSDVRNACFYHFFYVKYVFYVCLTQIQGIVVVFRYQYKAQRIVFIAVCDYEVGQLSKCPGSACHSNSIMLARNAMSISLLDHPFINLGL